MLSIFYRSMLVLSILFAFIAKMHAQYAVVELPKMNVLYIGVDNPMSFVVPKTPYKNVILDVSQGKIERNESGKYFVWRVTTSGIASLTFSVMENGVKRELAKKEYRVKKFPNPVARLGKDKGGTISAPEFKAQPGVYAQLEFCEIDWRCEVKSFTLTRVPTKNQTPVVCTNAGGRYELKAAALVNVAAAGDKYYFTDILSRCPGDSLASRKLNEMEFQIQ